LVVRGAGAAARSGFPIPLSIRTCGFPAYGLPMIFLTWLRCLRIADGTAEAVQAVALEPLACPLVGLPGVQVAARFWIMSLRSRQATYRSAWVNL